MPVTKPSDRAAIFKRYAEALIAFADETDAVKRLERAVEARTFAAAIGANLEQDLAQADRSKRHATKIKADGGKAEKSLRQIEKDTIKNLSERLVEAVRLVSDGNAEKLGRAVAACEELLRSGRSSPETQARLSKSIKETRELRERHSEALTAAKGIESAKLALEQLRESGVHSHVIKHYMGK